MALSDSEILDIWSPGLSRPILGKTKVLHFARAIEAEVRKADTELIRQMLDALENHAGNYKLTKTEAAVVNAAITAARARLGDEPTKAQPAIHPATVAACIARLEQGGQSAAASILRHHFEQKGG